ncbi:DUF397 domain-containing protein [Micromonospora chalcea]|uniref:DUF397 domain-containing protein n=1 Tax=Micromonospora chalcea TaxID=1874 RepID=UPI0023788DE9|nr:DUF397 domain-containing protein [Micromonospora chalcea]WDQ02840.1 DUF397 domain-containing protein [Micromonospora chalcea]
MEEANQAAVTWRKSTRSNGSGNCVEVADNLPGVVGLRDSKDPAGPALAFPPSSWAAFIRAVKSETLSR